MSVSVQAFSTEEVRHLVLLRLSAMERLSADPAMNQEIALLRVLIDELLDGVERLTARQDRTDRPEPALSPREFEVLGYTARGFSNLEVAQRLSVSPKTVDTYRSRIMAKLDLHRRSELVAYALRNGLLS